MGTAAIYIIYDNGTVCHALGRDASALGLGIHPPFSCQRVLVHVLHPDRIWQPWPRYRYLSDLGIVLTEPRSVDDKPDDALQDEHHIPDKSRVRLRVF
jgi:hypothetical protein